MGGRMSTEAAWGFGYPASWAQALQVRQRNAALVAAWVRVRADIRAQADAEWRRVVPRGAGPVIGVHLRGTDKFVMPQVPPARHSALIDAFMERHGGGGAAGAPARSSTSRPTTRRTRRPSCGGTARTAWRSSLMGASRARRASGYLEDTRLDGRRERARRARGAARHAAARQVRLLLGRLHR